MVMKMRKLIKYLAIFILFFHWYKLPVLADFKVEAGKLYVAKSTEYFSGFADKLYRGIIKVKNDTAFSEGYQGGLIKSYYRNDSLLFSVEFTDLNGTSLHRIFIRSSDVPVKLHESEIRIGDTLSTILRTYEIQELLFGEYGGSYILIEGIDFASFHISWEPNWDGADDKKTDKTRDRPPPGSIIDEIIVIPDN